MLSGETRYSPSCEFWLHCPPDDRFSPVVVFAIAISTDLTLGSSSAEPLNVTEPGAVVNGPTALVGGTIAHGEAMETDGACPLLLTMNERSAVSSESWSAVSVALTCARQVPSC